MFGDILYFTGLVESFGDFCEEHGLEVLTNETNHQPPTITDPTATVMDESGHFQDNTHNNGNENENENNSNHTHPSEQSVIEFIDRGGLSIVVEEADDTTPCDVGLTKESLLRADEAERSRAITRMTGTKRNVPYIFSDISFCGCSFFFPSFPDLIRGTARDEPDELSDLTPFRRISGGPNTPGGILSPSKQSNRLTNPNENRKSASASEGAQVVVTVDHDLVVIGVNAQDRPGLLLDLSKGLLRLNLTLRHTEASVVGGVGTTTNATKGS